MIFGMISVFKIKRSLLSNWSKKLSETVKKNVIRDVEARTTKTYIESTKVRSQNERSLLVLVRVIWLWTKWEYFVIENIQLFL